MSTTRRSPLARLLDALPAAAAVVVGAWVLIAYSVGQWRSMYVPSWDLAIFSELAKDYAHLEAPIVPIKGEGFNLLGDHFHPILVLLGPVWRLFPTPLALLVLQDLLLAVSTWPLTRLATRLVGRLAATVLGLVYVLSWGIQGAVAAQFHEIAFAVPMLAWASVAFVERRWWACALWLAPLVLVKEDLGLTVLMAGLAIILRARLTGADDAGAPPSPSSPARGPAWRRSLRSWALDTDPVRIGAGLALFGLLAFLLTVLVILPLLSPTGTWQYGIGGNSSDGTSTTATSGNLLLSLFSPSVKLTTLALLVCSAGLIGLGSPWLALVLPTLAWRFLSSKEFYWEWSNWHYNAVLMPIALGALLDVVARLRARGGLSGWRGWRGTPALARLAVAVGLVVPVLAGAWAWDQLPLKAMTEPGYGETSARAAAAQQVMDTIPEGSTVETDLGLLAYLVPKTTVYWVGTSGVSTDYVVIDSYSSAWGGNAPTDAAQWATQQSGGTATYSLVLSIDGYQVAKKVG